MIDKLLCRCEKFKKIMDILNCHTKTVAKFICHFYGHFYCELSEGPNYHESQIRSLLNVPNTFDALFPNTRGLPNAARPTSSHSQVLFRLRLDCSLRQALNLFT